MFSYRELLENSIAPKQQRLSPADLSQLIELLIHKDTELKETIKVSPPAASSSPLSHATFYHHCLCHKSED